MFSKLATLGGRPGLAEVVRGEASLEEAIVKLPGNDDVWLLGAGDAREPHAIFESPRLAEITQALATRFDAVILDGPPALPTADLPGLASAIDALVLVVRARKTPRELVMRALDVIEATGVTVAGAVLNGVEAGAGPVFELQAEHDRATRKPAAEVATIGARAAEVARS
jgi:Mrp family chromosome partitioning ATPase